MHEIKAACPIFNAPLIDSRHNQGLDKWTFEEEEKHLLHLFVIKNQRTILKSECRY